MPNLSDHLTPFQADPAYALALRLVQDLERLVRYGRCYDLSGRRLTHLGQAVHAFNNGQLAPIFAPAADLVEAAPLLLSSCQEEAD